MDLGGELRAGAEALGLELRQPQYDQLLEYLYLLEKWSRVYNLTAIRGLSKMLNYHLLDSLSLLPKLVACRKRDRCRQRRRPAGHSARHRHA